MYIDISLIIIIPEMGKQNQLPQSSTPQDNFEECFVSDL